MFGLAGILGHGVVFNLGSTKVCSSAIIETYFYYEKDIWIAVTDFYPTALKGCQGIVFTLGGRAAGNSLSGLFLRNRKV